MTPVQRDELANLLEEMLVAHRALDSATTEFSTLFTKLNLAHINIMEADMAYSKRIRELLIFIEGITYE